MDFIVLIPCFNNAEGLAKSISSIGYPTSRFELLIVDDGSDIPLNPQKIQAVKPEVSMHLIRLEKNSGIVKALNTGLAWLHARSDFNYIARLDCGDICSPERFTAQVEFLDAHPEIALLGTWCRFEDALTGKGYNYITKTQHKDIEKEMHFKCSFIHPAVMFRKEILDTVGYYPENYPHAEDYVFFWKMMKKYQTHVLPEILVHIQTSSSSLSSYFRKQQLSSRKKIIKDMATSIFMKWLGLIYLTLIGIIPSKFTFKVKVILFGK